MPVCKKCQIRFKCRIVLDGVERNFAARKYCLACSPFGKHNTMKMEHLPQPNTCKSCGKEYVKLTYRTNTLGICKQCYRTIRRKNTKQLLVDYKGGCCEQCGYSRCTAALDFHHQDPSKKDFTISKVSCFSSESIQRLKEEVDKCSLLCSNCHRELHSTNLV